MEFLRNVLQDMVDFYYGFYGWAIVLLVFWGIKYGIEELVKYVGKIIGTYKKAKGVQK